MKLSVNQKEYHTYSDRLTVEELLNELQSIKPGVAVAVNDKVVRKVNWNSTILTDGDQITIITAVCGG